MIEPIIAGTTLNPPISGPQLPKISVPNQAPTNPAIIFPITPPGTSRPVMRPASQPIIPPMIKLQINPMEIPPFTLLNLAKVVIS